MGVESGSTGVAVVSRVSGIAPVAVFTCPVSFALVAHVSLKSRRALFACLTAVSDVAVAGACSGDSFVAGSFSVAYAFIGLWARHARVSSVVVGWAWAVRQFKGMLCGF